MLRSRRDRLRAALRPFRRGVLLASDLVLPSPRASSLLDGPRSATLVSVYRYNNASTIRPLVEEAVRLGWSARLWALDQRAPSLDTWTVGTGPGPRFGHLNDLVGSLDIPDGHVLVVADDDIHLIRGSLAAFVGCGVDARLSVFQASHDPRSAYTYELTRAHVASIARETTFVEIGPLLALSATATRELFPVQVNSQDDMGWGIDVEWTMRRSASLRFGVIDVCRVVHLGAVGAAYDNENATAVLHERMATLGIHDFRKAQRTLARWRPWQDSPPWM